MTVILEIIEISFVGLLVICGKSGVVRLVRLLSVRPSVTANLVGKLLVIHKS